MFKIIIVINFQMDKWAIQMKHFKYFNKLQKLVYFMDLKLLSCINTFQGSGSKILKVLKTIN